jgi:hypothetical protein
MAKRKPFVTEPEPEPELEQAALPAEEQAEQFVDDGVQKIFELLRTLNLSGGRVRIFLKRPNVLKSGYVGDMTIEQFEDDGLETLKRMYGGGDYSLQFCDGESGKIVAQRGFTIDPRFRGEIDVELKASDKPADDRLATAIAAIRPAEQKQPENMMPLLITLITESNKTIASMMSANQAATNTILTGLMQAITSAQTKPGTDPVLLELIRQKTDKTPISETIEAFATLRDLTANGEPKEKEDMIEKVVKVFGPALASFFARQGMPVVPHMQLAPSPQQPQPQAAPPPAANGAAVEEPKLAQFTGLLLNAANRGTPAENYYDVIVDNITDDQFDTLITELKKPDWLENLFGNIPPVIAQKAWFEKLRAAFLEDAGEPADAPPQQPQEAAAK